MNAEVKDNEINGNIPVLDVQYGNVWTNIDKTQLEKIGINPGDSIAFSISYKGELKYEAVVPFTTTFSAVPVDAELAYMNSLLKLSLAINQGDFAKVHGVSQGADWNIKVKKR